MLQSPTCFENSPPNNVAMELQCSQHAGLMHHRCTILWHSFFELSPSLSHVCSVISAKVSLITTLKLNKDPISPHADCET